jgi:uncharacterized NAD-dependent epimerase/dehydratase family protein
MEIERPYLLFLGDVHDQLAAKTAQGVVDWRPDWCIGQLRLPNCQADTGLADMSIEDAVAKGARTMVVGVVNAGGVLPDHWIAEIVKAIEAGMNVATGLHKRLSSIPEIAEAAARHGAKLHDVRFSDTAFAASAADRRHRLLCGKMYTSLALEKAMRERGMNADFRATGQTGILITGEGVPLDAVIADFISGAVEVVAPENDPDHWDLIEGQGSLFHPSFAGVTLGLLHGSQPDEDAKVYMETMSHEHGLPCVDPIRTGMGPIVDEIQKRYPS